jgi:hypothetical protein
MNASSWWGASVRWIVSLFVGYRLIYRMDWEAGPPPEPDDRSWGVPTTGTSSTANGEILTAEAGGTGLTISAFRPSDPISTSPSSAGRFIPATPIDSTQPIGLMISQKLTYIVKGTFVSPVGPLVADNTWAIGVQVRDGVAESDGPDNKRLAATVLVNPLNLGVIVNLNLPNAKTAAVQDTGQTKQIPTMQDLFNPATTPFTLSLSFNVAQRWAKARYEHDGYSQELTTKIVAGGPLDNLDFTVAGVDIAIDKGSNFEASIICQAFEVFEAPYEWM